uniref:Protein kinase domain-containing protein n=1 Tax=Macrostomum lignano TaxID=282301 RepID=A0A1I8FF00_9PLAT
MQLRLSRLKASRDEEHSSIASELMLRQQGLPRQRLRLPLCGQWKIRSRCSYNSRPPGLPGIYSTRGQGAQQQPAAAAAASSSSSKQQQQYSMYRGGAAMEPGRSYGSLFERSREISNCNSTMSIAMDRAVLRAPAAIEAPATAAAFSSPSPQEDSTHSPVLCRRSARHRPAQRQYIYGSVRQPGAAHGGAGYRRPRSAIARGRRVDEFARMVRSAEPTQRAVTIWRSSQSWTRFKRGADSFYENPPPLPVMAPRRRGHLRYRTSRLQTTAPEDYEERRGDSDGGSKRCLPEQLSRSEDQPPKQRLISSAAWRPPSRTLQHAAAAEASGSKRSARPSANAANCRAAAAPIRSDLGRVSSQERTPPSASEQARKTAGVGPLTRGQRQLGAKGLIVPASCSTGGLRAKACARAASTENLISPAIIGDLHARPPPSANLRGHPSKKAIAAAGKSLKQRRPAFAPCRTDSFDNRLQSELRGRGRRLDFDDQEPPERELLTPVGHARRRRPGHRLMTVRLTPRADVASSDDEELRGQRWDVTKARRQFRNRFDTNALDRRRFNGR